MFQIPSEIVIATKNRGKIRELRALLNGLPTRLRSLDEFARVTDAIEDGSSFTENALIKAHHYSQETGKAVIADDSGLEVEALGQAPGILSARYGGATSDEARIQYLLNNLRQTGNQNRAARFVCVIALYGLQFGERAEPITFTGVCRGVITNEPRGTNGFGYDPIFIPDNFSETFAELPPQTKSRISHRANAIRGLYKFLELQIVATHDNH